VCVVEHPTRAANSIAAPTTAVSLVVIDGLLRVSADERAELRYAGHEFSEADVHISWKRRRRRCPR
jgi:hypothetical protein